jgi:predicted phosphodiesterase
MKVQIASDLHIEYKNEKDVDPFDYIIPSAEILILAGDIGSCYRYSQLRNFLKKLCPEFKIVLYVPGNHEYYYIPNTTRRMPIEFMNHMIHSLSILIPNLIILDRSSVIIGNICISGCTLWSNPKVAMPGFYTRLHGMDVEKYKGKFETDLTFVNEIIAYCKEKKHELVMVTHYCPHEYIALTEEHGYDSGKDELRSLYMTDLTHLMDQKSIKLWIYGHTHINFNMISQLGTKIVSNQKGKLKNNVYDFSEQFIVEI